MTASKRPWKIHRSHPGSVALAAELGVSAVVGQLLCNRDLTSASAATRWLAAPWGDLTPPEDLPGAADAGRELAIAAAQGEKICIYGDYDVDGTTGASTLYRTLSLLGSAPTVYLPHRLEEGYGLNAEAVRRIARSGHKLLVTVDCGVASAPEVDLALSLGLRVIVTDHHQPKEVLPGTLVVHPALPGRRATADNLCGSAVAWKVAWATLKAARGGRLHEEDREHLKDCLCLAAMGTVADVVPLAGENRLLVRHGLERLAGTTHAGLLALLDVAGLVPEDGGVPRVLAEDIGFRLGPRCNAAGRLGFAPRVVDLLTESSPARARELAAYLDYANKLRQQIERGILEGARLQAERQVERDRAALVVGSADWHPGVIGIVASRLVERFQRPALVVSFGTRHGLGYGSGRSTPNLALHTALAACSSQLVAHGGHAAAAGFKVRPENFAALQEDFWRHAEGTFGGVPPPQPLVMEAELRLAEVSVALVRDLARLEPHGAANPRPLFFVRGARLEQVRVIGKEQTHLSLTFSQPGAPPVRCIAFGMAERRRELCGPTDLAAVPGINEWRGRQSAELEIKDFRPSPRP